MWVHDFLSRVTRTSFLENRKAPVAMRESAFLVLQQI